ncbi:MAG: hypothetical protein CMO55_13700 [Verrucomicrobiales bacterium]|nr:hypothetical protein [Verrucomicrobiales bacterium]
MKNSLLLLVASSLLVGGTATAGDWRSSAKNLAPLAPPPAVESCLSYDYVDLEYQYTDFGSTYFDQGHGFGLGFSKSLGSMFYVNGSFSDGEYEYNWDNHFLDVDTKKYRLGAGVHAPIAKCIDITFEGGGEHLDAEYAAYYNDHDYDSWGYYFGPGIRARAGRLEMFGKAYYYGREGDLRKEYLSHHTHYPGIDDEYGWLFTAGLIYHVTDCFGIKFSAEFDDDDTLFTVGGRYHF